jgi:hypothetical protein
VRVLVQLTRQFGDEDTAVGFYVLTSQADGPQKLIIHDTDIIARSQYAHASSVAAEVWLPLEGVTILIPSTFQPNLVGAFRLDVCSPMALSLQPLASDTCRVTVTHSGEWDARTAGGCRNFESWADNPQYAITVSQPITALFILSQHIAPSLLPIGLYVLNKDGATQGKAAFMHALEVSCQVDLLPQHSPYLIMPCTFQPGTLGRFHLSAYTTQPLDFFDVADEE